MAEINDKICLNESKQSTDYLGVPASIDKISSEKGKLSQDDKRQQTEKQKKQENEKIKREAERKKKENEKEQDRKKKELEKKEEQKKKEGDRKRKEEEKKIRQLERDEEKRKKEEEKRLKDAEKEEDRRKKEEEKKRKEEKEKNKILKKQRASITDFFLKKDKIDQEPLESSYDLKSVSFFKPIEIKKDMRMAQVERHKIHMIQSIPDLGISDLTYIDEITIKKSGIHIQVDTWPISETDCEVIESTLSRRLETKSFLFTENVRPPYFGTWRKLSKLITPLHPLAEDITFFDYDIDSDQEWEYESGEDISNSEGEEEEEVNEDVDDNSFLVPHGYLSDGEDCSDVDADVEAPEALSKRPMSPKSRQSIIEIREKQFQAEVNQKVQKINPKIIGPFFIDNESSMHLRIIMEPYHMICQNIDGFPINCNLQSDFDHSQGSTKIKSVPTEAVPLLIRLLHHNGLSRAKICYEFRMYWEYHLTNRLPDVTFDDDLKGKDWDEFTIGKKRLIDKIKEIAERKEGKWIVKPEVIHEYQLCCIDDDPSKVCSEQWKYVSGVLKISVSKKSQKKLKLVDGQSQNIIVNEPKLSKKRKQPTDLVMNVREKNMKTLNLNPSVQLIDNAEEKMTEIKKKAMYTPMLDNNYVN